MSTTDVAIIGGGIIGCSIAFHLAQAGVTRTVVFERKHVASGATGICPGGIRQQFEGEAECILAQRSMRFFEQINQKLQPEAPFFLERSGYLFLAESEPVLMRFRRNVEMQNKLGIPSRILGPAEIVPICESLVLDGVVGGSYCGEDGFLEDCDGVTNRMLRVARDQGAKLVLQQVVRIEQENGCWRLTTPADSYLAKQVVIAAGVDTPTLVDQLGWKVPIQVERRRLAYTEPLATPVMHPLVVALERGFAGKQLLNGVFYLGWLGETAKSDSLTFTEHALTAGATLLPALAELPVRRIVEGFYDSTPDHRPILGLVPGLNGLFLAAGFSGHGFMLAPAVGEIMANLISDQGRDPLVDHFSPQRFARSLAGEGLQI
jgi:sarcosine oxidase, subunit beta